MFEAIFEMYCLYMVLETPHSRSLQVFSQIKVHALLSLGNARPAILYAPRPPIDGLSEKFVKEESVKVDGIQVAQTPQMS